MIEVEEFRLRSTLYCPFLLPILSDRPWTPAGRPYCRLAPGRPRLLPAATAREVCANGRYYDCPVYRFWRGREPSIA